MALWERELGDGSEAVREVVRHIAFLRWKLRRLDEVEDRRLHGEVLHRLDGTEEMGRLRTVEGAHCAVATMAEVMAAAVPQAREQLDKLLVPVDSVLIMLEAVEDTGPKVFVGAKPLAEAVGTLRSESPRTTHAGAYAAVVERAVATLAELQRLLPEVRAALASAKVRIRSEMPLPGDRDAALRVRYRRDVERRLNAEMRFLMQVRELRVGRGASGSLGQVGRPGDFAYAEGYGDKEATG